MSTPREPRIDPSASGVVAPVSTPLPGPVGSEHGAVRLRAAEGSFRGIGWWLASVGLTRVARHGHAGALGIVVLCTIVAALMDHDFERANLTMVYLLGVVIAAITFGRGPAITAAVVSVAMFDFIFVPPRWTFRVSDVQYLVTFAVMLVVAVVIGTLTARLRDQWLLAREREHRTASLDRLGAELARADSPARMLSVAAHSISEALGTRVAVLVRQDGDGLVPMAGASELVSGATELEAARRAHEAVQPVGLGRGTEGSRAIHIPMAAGVECLGVLSLAWPARDGSEPLELARALAARTAGALERARLAAEAERARTQAQAERARSALLSSVSHDLRTPLTAITGAATTLAAEGTGLPESTRRALAETIADEAQRLNRLIGNLLDMTRLEAGALRVNREWHSLEEIVGAALDRLAPMLGARPVHVSIPATLPLVPVDAVLLELVLSNLLENAHKYSPADSVIELSAAFEDRTLRLIVADRGRGLSPGEERRVFEKFYRGERAQGIAGSGLGLAICRAVVEAHGGRIEAHARSGGGTELEVLLPIAGDAPSVPPEQADSIEARVRP